MARKRVSARTKRQVEHLSITSTIVQQWRAVGTAHRLSSDSEIAAFLLQLYEKSGLGVNNNNHESCISCNQPLPRYLCAQCSASCDSILAAPQDSSPVRRHKAKASPGLDLTDLRDIKVKVEREDDEMIPSHRQLPAPVRGRKQKAVAALEDGEEMEEVEVKVEAADLRSGCEGDQDSNEDEEAVLPVNLVFEDGEADPDFSHMDDPDLTEDVSDTEPEPKRKLKKRRPRKRCHKNSADPDFDPENDPDLTDDVSDAEPEPKRKLKKRLPRKLKDKTGVKFECGHCSATFKQAYRLKRHSKIHAADYGKDRLYSCEQCRMTFRHKGSLDSHMRQHSGQQPYMCAICNAAFSTAKQTKQHVKSQHSDQLNVVPCFKCRTCQREFLLHKKFTTHVWRHTLERKFQCEHCPMAFFEQSSLRAHQSIHTGYRPFTCSECGLSFRQLCHLNRHLLTHSGERPHHCTLCPATYPDSQQLKRHLRGHRGEKPFLCQLCGASYTESKSLMYHFRSHTGEKPFKCDLCEKEFARPSSLRVHKRTHSCDRPYTCAICGASFADNSNLHRHHRLKHLGKSKKRLGGGGGRGGVFRSELANIQHTGCVSVQHTDSVHVQNAVSVQNADCVNVQNADCVNVQNRSKCSLTDQPQCSMPLGDFKSPDLNSVVLDLGAGRVGVNSVSVDHAGADLSSAVLELGASRVGVNSVSVDHAGADHDSDIRDGVGASHAEKLTNQLQLLPVSMVTTYPHSSVLPAVVPFRY